MGDNSSVAYYSVIFSHKDDIVSEKIYDTCYILNNKTVNTCDTLFKKKQIITFSLVRATVTALNMIQYSFILVK